MYVKLLEILVSFLFIRLWVQCYVSASSSTVCDCWKSKAVATRLVGGSIMHEQEHPSLALLHYRGRFFCGGSIVSQKHILTAAHCVFNRNIQKDLSIFLGVHDRVKAFNKNVKKHTVEKILIHEGFKTLHYHILINDIALLQVNEIKYSRYIQPICLPFHFDWSGYKLVVVEGWGDTKEKGYPSRFARKVVLSLLTTPQCQKTKVYDLLKHVNNIDEMVLCAYKAFADSCQGDSGGPLSIKTENGINVQLGIVSFGPGCSNHIGLPGLYTRVSHYLGWLDQHLHLNCSV